jgi:G6PDH family F420-dependent oxidoreductase
MRLGYWLNCEELAPDLMLEQARLAERVGFTDLWISDHYHPWNDAQGQSAFVWSIIGALSGVCGLPVTTAVTCPTVRIHPAIIAQAAATSAVLHGGRFTLGVGSGEALNEHVLGHHWPNTDVRLDMLAEAVEVIRKLWSGDFVNHHGPHYTVEDARIYTLPERPPAIYVSGLAPKSTALAARIGDGYINASPDAELVRAFRAAGGGDKPATGGFKACYAADEDEAVAIAYRLWPNAGVPGEASRVLSSPRHFEQLTKLVPPSMMREKFVCGPNPEPHLQMIDKFTQAGFDHIYVANVGPHYRDFFDLYEKQVLPQLR